jgi:hypothetical protein
VNWRSWNSETSQKSDVLTMVKVLIKRYGRKLLTGTVSLKGDLFFPFIVTDMSEFLVDFACDVLFSALFFLSIQQYECETYRYLLKWVTISEIKQPK